VRFAATLHKDDTVYVNTLLPFGAAMAGRLRGCKVIYHIHEVSVKPESLRTFLQRVAGFTAARMLFVSQYVADSMPAGKARKEVIYNALPDSFVEEAAYVRWLNRQTPFTVTMLCSLKAYKGVYHFINIARMMPDLNFVLVLNAPEKEVTAFRKLVKVPNNCTVHDAQKNTVPFYAQAHVVCNLSKPDGWIETFGMTLLEAMHCGRPVICPTVGGVREVVDHGIQGFAIDSANEQQICQTLYALATQPELYKQMSDAACKRAAAFDREHFAIIMLAAFEEPCKAVQKTNMRQGVFPKTGKVVSWIKL
jgi:glycosyltransferase involved in cell wall biosynthesis